jgi:hypothetical protein
VDRLGTVLTYWKMSELPEGTFVYD